MADKRSYLLVSVAGKAVTSRQKRSEVLEVLGDLGEGSLGLVFGGGAGLLVVLPLGDYLGDL